MNLDDFKEAMMREMEKAYAMQSKINPDLISYKEDCFWYFEWQDMNARIPACKKKKGELLFAPSDCMGCQFYKKRDLATNADMFEQIFGFKPKCSIYDEKEGCSICVLGRDCDLYCDLQTDKRCIWWEQPYKKPKE